MSDTPQPAPSFSTRRRFGIGLNVGLITVVVLAVVVMINFLNRDYFWRFHWSSRNRVQLAPLTVKFLQSLTNRVRVTLYYDKTEPLYPTVSSLLGEYRNANPHISITTVDYLRDPGAAQKIKADYKLAAATDKNLVIFDCEGRKMVVPGDLLTKYVYEQVGGGTEPKFLRKPAAFEGEKWFTSTLIAVTNPKPLNAYFLEGHYEHGLESADEAGGYAKFAAVLQQNYISTIPLSLQGTNQVPGDCHLLVIAGPRTAIPPSELEKIDQYLDQGGRLLVLFNAASLNKETGLEKILAKWGVGVGNNIVVDREHSDSESGMDIIVSAFSKHPLVSPLLGSGIYMVRPRTISRLNPRSQAADAPKVDELAGSGTNSFLLGDTEHRQAFPLMAAVEKGAIKGVTTERGTTRMLVIGDSQIFCNADLEVLGNRDLAGFAANWLLDRSQLLEALGPRPINPYKLVMTKKQMRTTQWVLLAGLPGGVLAVGGLVWLRRRR
jgi:hypothetical protein